MEADDSLCRTHQSGDTSAFPATYCSTGSQISPNSHSYQTISLAQKLVDIKESILYWDLTVDSIHNDHAGNTQPHLQLQFSLLIFIKILQVAAIVICTLNYYSTVLL